MDLKIILKPHSTDAFLADIHGVKLIKQKFDVKKKNDAHIQSERALRLTQFLEATSSQLETEE